MQDIHDIRRRNALSLLNAKFGGVKARMAEAIDRVRPDGDKMPPSYLSRALIPGASGARNIGQELARDIERASGVPVNWLDQDHAHEPGMSDDDVAAALPQLGAGAPPSEAQLTAAGLKKTFAAAAEAFILIPQLTVKPSAGNGGYEIDFVEAVDGEDFAFKRSYFRKRGIKPERAAVLIANGNSMAPLINHDDAVLVDLDDIHTLKTDLVYVFLVHNELRIKKARWRMNRDLELISENANHPVEVIPRDQLDSVHCVGRAFNRSGDI